MSFGQSPQGIAFVQSPQTIARQAKRDAPDQQMAIAVLPLIGLGAPINPNTASQTFTGPFFAASLTPAQGNYNPDPLYLVLTQTITWAPGDPTYQASCTRVTTFDPANWSMNQTDTTVGGVGPWVNTMANITNGTPALNLISETNYPRPNDPAYFPSGTNTFTATATNLTVSCPGNGSDARQACTISQTISSTVSLATIAGYCSNMLSAITFDDETTNPAKNYFDGTYNLYLRWMQSIAFNGAIIGGGGTGFGLIAKHSSGTNTAMSVQGQIPSPGLGTVWGMCIDGSGNVYTLFSFSIGATPYVQIYKSNPTTNTTTKIFELSYPTTYPGAVQVLIYGTGIAVDSAGNLYVNGAAWFDGGGNPHGLPGIYKITPAGSISCIVIAANFVPDGYTTTSTDGLAIDGSGNLFWSDQYAKKIRKWTAGTGTVSTVTTTGTDVPGVLCLDPSGNIYVYIGTLSATYFIKKWDGSSLSTAATLASTAHGICSDSSGTIYFTDAETGEAGISINKIVAGTPTPVLQVGNGINFPLQIAVSASGDIYYTDIGATPNAGSTAPGGGGNSFTAITVLFSAPYTKTFAAGFACAQGLLNSAWSYNPFDGNAFPTQATGIQLPYGPFPKNIVSAFGYPCNGYKYDNAGAGPDAQTMLLDNINLTFIQPAWQYYCPGDGYANGIATSICCITSKIKSNADANAWAERFDVVGGIGGAQYDQVFTGVAPSGYITHTFAPTDSLGGGMGYVACSYAGPVVGCAILDSLDPTRIPTTESIGVGSILGFQVFGLNPFGEVLTPLQGGTWTFTPTGGTIVSGDFTTGTAQLQALLTANHSGTATLSCTVDGFTSQTITITVT